MLVTITTPNESPTPNVTFTFLNGMITTLKESVNSEIDHMAMPMSGPAGAFAYDFNGVVKRITISGKLRASSVAEGSRTNVGNVFSILQQKQWLESLQFGNQTACQFASNYASQSGLDSSSAASPYQISFTNTMVYVEKFDCTKEEANPDLMPFEMSFIVAEA